MCRCLTVQINMVPIPTVQQGEVATGVLNPTIHCTDLYTNESIFGGRIFHASFLAKKKKQRKGIWLWIRVTWQELICVSVHIQYIRRKGYLYLWNKTDLTSVTTSRLALYPAQTMATWMVCRKRGTKRRKIKACSCVLSVIRESTYMTVLLFSAAIVKDLSGCSAAVCSPLEAVC